MRIGIYPGSFDPATMGHLDVIERASRLYDKLIVVVMVNAAKKSMFCKEEKVSFLKRITKHLPNVEIDFFGGLLADYAKEKGACAIVKGLRAVSDFEYEFQMALANRKLNPEVDTVFLMTSSQYMYLSSSIVKEIALMGGDISGFVSDEIYQDIINKFNTGGR
jgi:pantetheine-phosphate adenylyltransferase